MSALVVKALSESGNGECLARCTSDKDIRGFKVPGSDLVSDGGEVPEVGGVRPVVGKDGTGERLDLGKPRCCPPQRLPSR